MGILEQLMFKCVLAFI